MVAVTHVGRTAVPKVVRNVLLGFVATVTAAMAWMMTAAEPSGWAYGGWLSGAAALGAAGWLVAGRWVSDAQARLTVGLLSAAFLLVLRISTSAMGVA